MAVSELFPIPALALAAATLQGNSVPARQGGLLGSGAISGASGFIRDQMQAGIDERSPSKPNSRGHQIEPLVLRQEISS
jgi:hypothetical protein